MNIKCYRFECSQRGEIASIQAFYRKDETAGYARARHKNTQGVHYHKQTTEYANQKLRELNKIAGSIDRGQVPANKLIDPNNLISSCFRENKAGPMGFEPTTFSLEG